MDSGRRTQGSGLPNDDSQSNAQDDEWDCFDPDVLSAMLDEAKQEQSFQLPPYPPPGGFVLVTACSNSKHHMWVPYDPQSYRTSCKMVLRMARDRELLEKVERSFTWDPRRPTRYYQTHFRSPEEAKTRKGTGHKPQGRRGRQQEQTEQKRRTSASRSADGQDLIAGGDSAPKGRKDGDGKHTKDIFEVSDAPNEPERTPSSTQTVFDVRPHLRTQDHHGALTVCGIALFMRFLHHGIPLVHRANRHIGRLYSGFCDMVQRAIQCKRDARKAIAPADGADLGTLLSALRDEYGRLYAKEVPAIVKTCRRLTTVMDACVKRVRAQCCHDRSTHAQSPPAKSQAVTTYDGFDSPSLGTTDISVPETPSQTTSPPPPRLDNPLSIQLKYSKRRTSRFSKEVRRSHYQGRQRTQRRAQLRRARERAEVTVSLVEGDGQSPPSPERGAFAHGSPGGATAGPRGDGRRSCACSWQHHWSADKPASRVACPYAKQHACGPYFTADDWLRMVILSKVFRCDERKVRTPIIALLGFLSALEDTAGSSTPVIGKGRQWRGLEDSDVWPVPRWMKERCAPRVHREDSGGKVSSEVPAVSQCSTCSFLRSDLLNSSWCLVDQVTQAAVRYDAKPSRGRKPNRRSASVKEDENAWLGWVHRFMTSRQQPVCLHIGQVLRTMSQQCGFFWEAFLSDQHTEWVGRSGDVWGDSLQGVADDIDLETDVKSPIASEDEVDADLSTMSAAGRPSLSLSLAVPVEPSIRSPDDLLTQSAIQYTAGHFATAGTQSSSQTPHDFSASVGAVSLATDPTVPIRTPATAGGVHYSPFSTQSDPGGGSPRPSPPVRLPRAASQTGATSQAADPAETSQMEAALDSAASCKAREDSGASRAVRGVTVSGTGVSQSEAPSGPTPSSPRDSDSPGGLIDAVFDAGEFQTGTPQMTSADRVVDSSMGYDESVVVSELSVSRLSDLAQNFDISTSPNTDDDSPSLHHAHSYEKPPATTEHDKDSQQTPHQQVSDVPDVSVPLDKARQFLAQNFHKSPVLSQWFRLHLGSDTDMEEKNVAQFASQEHKQCVQPSSPSDVQSPVRVVPVKLKAHGTYRSPTGTTPCSECQGLADVRRRGSKERLGSRRSAGARKKRCRVHRKRSPPQSLVGTSQPTTVRLPDLQGLATVARSLAQSVEEDLQELEQELEEARRLQGMTHTADGSAGSSPPTRDAAPLPATGDANSMSDNDANVGNTQSDGTRAVAVALPTTTPVMTVRLPSLTDQRKPPTETTHVGADNAVGRTAKCSEGGDTGEIADESDSSSDSRTESGRSVSADDDDQPEVSITADESTESSPSCESAASPELSAIVAPPEDSLPYETTLSPSVQASVSHDEGSPDTTVLSDDAEPVVRVAPTPGPTRFLGRLGGRTATPLGLPPTSPRPPALTAMLHPSGRFFDAAPEEQHAANTSAGGWSAEGCDEVNSPESASHEGSEYEAMLDESDLQKVEGPNRRHITLESLMEGQNDSPQAHATPQATWTVRDNAPGQLSPTVLSKTFQNQSPLVTSDGVVLATPAYTALSADHDTEFHSPTPLVPVQTVGSDGTIPDTVPSMDSPLFSQESDGSVRFFSPEECSDSLLLVNTGVDRHHIADLLSGCQTTSRE